MKFLQLALLFAIPAAFAQEGQTIIDTQFNLPAGGQYQPAPPPAADSELPLKAPTSFGVTAPSVLEAGSETVGEVKPPYLLAKVGERPDNPEAPANLHVLWNLKELPTEPGRYVLKVKLGILDALSDAGNLAINLLNAENQPLDRRGCPVIAFPNGKIRSVPGKEVPFAPGEIYNLEIQFDTEKFTWSSSVNGETLREEAPMSQELIDAALGSARISGLSFYSVGGADNSRPGSSVALFDVKLIHLK